MNIKNLRLIVASAGLCLAGVALAATPQSVQKKAPGNVNLRAAVSYSEGWTETPFPYGIYDVSTEQGVDPEFYFLTEDRNLEGGVVYADGVIYAISKGGSWEYDEEEEELVFTSKGGAIFTAYDAATGDVLFEKTEGVSTDLYSQDLAYDKSTGKIYGVFRGNTYTYKWGTLDVDNAEIEYINEKMSTGLSAIDFAANGTLYGITTGGDLVTVDKNTGVITETLASYSKYQGYKSCGVIDQDTNTFYWFLHGYGNNAGLYAVDLNSYEMTKLRSFPDMQYWGGAYIAEAEVNEGVPAKAENLKMNFMMPGAILATLSFDAPAVDADGEDISGQTLNYVVKVNDNQIAQGEVVAGQSCTTSYFSAPEGYCTATVILSNENGESAPASITEWIGNDSPSNVQNISLTNDGYTVNLTWDAPVASVHNGHFEPNRVTYNVTRMPDKVLVAEDIDETSFTETIESKKAKKYYYTITPFYKGNEGKSTDSEKIVLGEGVNLPWSVDFDGDDDEDLDEESLELFVIEDTNNDGNTWDVTWGPIYRFGDNDGDDWFFTVPFRFEKGNAYHLKTQFESGLSRLEEVEIKVGNAPKSSAMSISLLEPTEFEGEYYYVDKYFSVPETGTYFIGFHALSPSTHFSLFVNNILVETSTSEEAPDAATVKPTAGAKGTLTATLEITAPTKSFSGNALTSLEGANIFNKEGLIGTLDDVEPGKTYTFTDEHATAGFNEYTVVFANEYGNGMEAKTRVFVGCDTPLVPKNVHLSFEEDMAHLTWETPGELGVNGGYVDPETLKYHVMFSTEDGDWDAIEETTSTSAYIEYNPFGSQRWFICAIAAANDLGDSETAYSNSALVGEKYSMPYLESLDYGHNNTIVTSADPMTYVVSYSSDTQMSASEIPGCLTLTPFSLLNEPPYIETLTTGVINTAGFENLTLSFYYYNDAALNNGVELNAALYDQENDVTYNFGSVKMDGSATEWRKFEATKKISADNLRIHIGINTANDNTIYLDEIKLDGISSVAGILANGVLINAAGGEILVTGLEGQTVSIANMSGILVYNAQANGDITVPVEAGVYVVRVADKVVKVVVK